MSIYKAFAFAGLMALGGCTAAQLAPDEDGGGVVQAKLRSGIVVQGPDGYCVDPATSQIGLFQSAVTLFSCARLKDPNAADPTDGYFMTATSVAGRLEDSGDLGAFLRSDAGRRVLSRQDEPDAITVHRTRSTRIATYVDYSDANAPTHLGQRQWRGFVPVDGQIVMLSLYKGANSSVAGDRGERIIRDFAAQVVRVNQDPS